MWQASSSPSSSGPCNATTQRAAIILQFLLHNCRAGLADCGCQVFGCQVVASNPLPPFLPPPLEARQIKPLSAGEFAVRVRYFRCSQAAGCRHGWAAYLAVCLTICLPLFPSLPSPSLALSVSVCLCLRLHLLSLSKQRARRLCNCLPSGSLSQLATQSTSHALTHSLIESFTLIHSLIHSLQLASHAVANCRRANNENINEHNIK